MNFGEIFAESMKAMAQGDRVKMEELNKKNNERIEKIRKEKERN